MTVLRLADTAIVLGAPVTPGILLKSGANGNNVKILAHIPIALFGVLTSLATSAGGPLLKTSTLDSHDLPIYQSRVHIVPESVAPHAFMLLGISQLRRLDEAALGNAAWPDVPDCRAMLGEQAAAAEAFAAKTESFLSRAPDAAQADSLRRSAEAHRAFAEYTRGLEGKLRPYLIKVHGRFGEVANYRVELRDDVLHVLFSTLGNGAAPPNDVPVVVFLERPITRVDAAVGGAE